MRMLAIALRAAGLGAAVTAALWVEATTTAPASTSVCSADWCRPGALEAEAQRIIDAQLAELTAGRDCWAPDARPGEIPATVVVKGAERDTSVVWTLTLDEAFAANGDGDSWNDVIVVRACAAG